MRAKKALLNTLFSLLQQFVGVVCGFIVPIAYITAFGSEAYGAIGAITQYLGFIALLEAGVGGVTRAALYGPLAAGNATAVSAIVRATERFFRGIGGAFVAYALLIACIFPFITQFSGEWSTAFALTLIIASGTLAQYMFGITYSVLLQADQRSYITSFFQIIAYIVNAVIVIVMVNRGFDVLAVQGASAALYVLRPVILGLYVRRRYKLIRAIEPDKTAIKDRWSGLGHHLAFFLRSNVAIVALSVFAPLSEVAIFTVYSLVSNGLQKIVSSFSTGIEAAFGNMIAKKEGEALSINFRVFEIVSSVIISVAYATAFSTILPFISLYTSGVNDANYCQPALAFFILAASAVYCFRLPYNSVVLAAGHYRQTRNGAFVEAGLCVILSFALAMPFGAAGVAAALLFATTFRTIQYGHYASKEILGRSVSVFYRQVCFLVITMAICAGIGLEIAHEFQCSNYYDWVLLAAMVLAESAIIVLLSASLFYRNDSVKALKKIKGVFGRGQ